MISDKYHISMSDPVNINKHGKIEESTYLSPRACRFRPFSVDTGVSLPRGLFEIVIDADSASTVVSKIWNLKEKGMRVIESD